MVVAANLFERLREKQPQQLEQPAEPEIVRRGPQPIIPLIHLKSSPSEKLLAWLVNYWPGATVTLRDIRAYGPHSVRDPQDVMNLTQTLTEFGWLVPVPARRRDMKKWRVVREPSKEAAK
jgi:hypothetical protein